MNQYSRFIDEERPITKELIKETLDIISGKMVPVEKVETVPVDFFKFSENYLNQKKDRIEKPTFTLYKGTLTKLKKYACISSKQTTKGHLKNTINAYVQDLCLNFNVYLK
jgi:hypothetical protein